MNPSDLSTPALRNAFCLSHDIPGWLLFSPGEFAQIEMAHSKMKAEIGQWRLAAKTGFGAKTPEGLTKVAQVRIKRAQAEIVPETKPLIQLSAMTKKQFDVSVTKLQKGVLSKEAEQKL